MVRVLRTEYTIEHKDSNTVPEAAGNIQGGKRIMRKHTEISFGGGGRAI